MKRTNSTLALVAAFAVAGVSQLHAQTAVSLGIQTDTAGLQTDSSSPTSFTYTGANTRTLHVQLKADKWDDYTLTFTDNAHGSFVRQQYKNNAYFDTDSDTFTISQSAP